MRLDHYPRVGHKNVFSCYTKYSSFLLKQIQNLLCGGSSGNDFSLRASSTTVCFRAFGSDFNGTKDKVGQGLDYLK